MNEQERINLFALALQALRQQYGVQIAVHLNTRQYGDMVQVEPVTQLICDPNWQPPQDNPPEE